MVGEADYKESESPIISLVIKECIHECRRHELLGTSIFLCHCYSAFHNYAESQKVGLQSEMSGKDPE